MTSPPLLSLLVPIYNEAETIPVFHARATHVLAQCCKAYEIIFVDDGSDDASLEILRRLQSEDAHLRVVSFSRNFGHQIAVTAALQYSRGNAVVVIDGDLQDPPELIPAMLTRWQEGYQVVYAIRRQRPECWWRRMAYHLFYRLLYRFSYVHIPLDSGDFALLDRCVVEVLKQMPEHNRFIRGLRAWAGFRQSGIAYDRQERYAGASKYPLHKLLQLAYDGLISYSFLPLRLVTRLGFMVSTASFALIIYLVLKRLFYGTNPRGWTSIVVVILFLGGVQLVSLGILGEYIGRIFDEVKRRPLYVVKDLLGFDGTGHSSTAPHRPPGDS